MTSRGAEKMNNDTIGVDVSKDHLDAHRLADGATRRFANTKGGHKALIKWVAETPLYRVVFEPTGLYHRAVERALGIAGVPFVKVNPRQARRFAEATGKLAKTDRLDAAILARMGALLELEARPARSELLFELKELYVAREALVKDRTAAKNRGKALTLSLLKRQNAQRLEQIDRQIATVEAAILQIIEANVRSRRSLRHPDQHSRRIQHHRLCLADRNAGARLPRSRPGRQPRRPWAESPTVRALDRSLIHSRRSRRRPPSALHARPRRRTLQPGHEGQIRSPHRNRKAGKGRLDRNHAKARRPRKRPPKGQSPLDAKNRLINTDTLALVATFSTFGIWNAQAEKTPNYPSLVAEIRRAAQPEDCVVATTTFDVFWGLSRYFARPGWNQSLEVQSAPVRRWKAIIAKVPEGLATRLKLIARSDRFKVGRPLGHTAIPIIFGLRAGAFSSSSTAAKCPRMPPSGA